MAMCSLILMNKFELTDKNSRFFYDPSDFPELKKITGNFQVIRKELISLLKQKELPNWTTIFPSYVSSENATAWEMFTFLFFSIRSSENAATCPQTAAFIFSVPQIISADFSRLKPKTKILPHTGFTKTILRCHLPLIIPGENKCGIRVGDETMYWKEGELMIFDDSFEHEAWNDSDEERVVLMFDIPNPAWGYSALEISKYKITNLEDDFLLSLFSKEKWLEMFNQRKFIF
jgi:aspartyl/asparaginyl beta-hydroxylase (cupin superfamily)